MQTLHNEILAFSALAAATPAELELLDEVVSAVSAVVRGAFDGKRACEVFGSLATGLLLPSSDVDLCCLHRHLPGEESSADGTEVREVRPSRWTMQRGCDRRLRCAGRSKPG
jgi:DNA polymerase sigma